MRPLARRSTKGVLWTDAGREQQRELDALERELRGDYTVLEGEGPDVLADLEDELREVENELDELSERADELRASIRRLTRTAEGDVIAGLELLIAAGRDHDGALARALRRRRDAQEPMRA